MKTIKYLTLVLLVVLSACESEEKGDVKPAEVIKSIQTGVRSDNALRVDVEIDFKQQVEFYIEYWKSGAENSKKSTTPAEGFNSTTATLIMLEPNTEYTFKVIASNQSVSTVSDAYTFTTQQLPSSVPVYSIQKNATDKEIPGYVMQIRMDKPGYITLTNSEGTIVWYQNMGKAVKVANFDPKTNTFAVILGDHPAKDYTGDWITVMDLFGNIQLDRESRELYPHHDIRRLPNGDLIVVNYVPKPFDLTEWGGSETEMVWGDGYTIMDTKGNIKTQWDCFVEMDPADDPHIMEMVAITSTLENPLYYKDDWLHANSLNIDADGNFYMTFNWLNQLWKINPQTGKVDYRVGINGNIDLPEEGLTQGIHTAMPLNPDKILVLDNGMMKQSTRALIYEIDKESKKAIVTMKVGLPAELSSPYMSSATIIGDNLLMFGSSFACAVIYTDFDGNILRTITSQHQSYRAEYISEINY